MDELFGSLGADGFCSNCQVIPKSGSGMGLASVYLAQIGYWTDISNSAFCSKSNIFQTIWQWVKRRHPQKGRHWIKKKYFRFEGNRSWIFYGELKARKGKPRHTRLFRASDTPIKRHVKIRGKANPYDPEWEIYFEERLSVKLADDLKGRRQLLRLWQEQDGICPVCHQKITKLTGWHNHHLVWRTHGGSDKAENRVLLHPNCHHQAHSLGLTVVKPRPVKGV